MHAFIRIRLAPALVAALCLLAAGCSGATHSRFKESVRVAEEPEGMSAEQHEQTGDVFARQNQAELAFVHYAKALAQTPENQRLKLKKARMLERRGLSAEALAEVDAVLAVEPGNVEAGLFAGELAFELHDYDTAKKHLQAALASSPGTWRARNLLGVIHNTRLELEDGRRELEAALAQAPRSGEVRNNLGVNRFLAGDYEAAVAQLEAALALGHTNPKVYNNLGLAHARLGNEVAALAAFRCAGGEARAYNNMGCILLGDARIEEAAQYFHKALAASASYYVKARENLDRAELLMKSHGTGMEQASVPGPQAARAELGETALAR